MSSQFTNGYPSSDIRFQYPVASHPHLDQSGGQSSSFNHSNSNAGAWDPSMISDGVPRGPYNSNQLSSEFGSMQIGGGPGHPWSQGANQPIGHPNQPVSYAQGQHMRAPSPLQLSGANALPSHQPGSTAFRPNVPRAFNLQQPGSCDFTYQQPPTSAQLAFSTHPSSSFIPPSSFSFMEQPRIGGPPLPSAMRPTLGSPAQSRPVETYTNAGPQQFPPGSDIPAHGHPGGQWGYQPIAHQQNILTNPLESSQHNAFNSHSSQSVQSQLYTSQPLPASGPTGYPAPGFQGQRPRYPGAQPVGSSVGTHGSYHGQPYLNQGSLPSQPPPNKRLDPDHMPSQTQVIEDDKKNRRGSYKTGQRGNVPPLVTSDFIVEDEGTCSPRFFRATMYNIPCSGDLLRQTHIPAAVVITPFARLHPSEFPPPIVDLGRIGPVRCNRCKAYMCPGMTFTDGGKRFQCCFCSGITEVPPEYYSHLDHTGKRFDCYERPELHLGAYEFVAPIEYCQDEKLPQPPAFIFMIDVSFPSIKSGLVNLLCTRLKNEILSNLPKDVGEDKSEVMVGFVTYSQVLHFYNIKGNLSQPQMLVVSDVNDVFIPLVDGFLVKPSEAEVLIDSLMVQISQMFSDNQERETMLGPVIQAGLDALKSSERVGKLFIFHSSLPTLEAPGKLKPRDDKSLLGTDKEKNLLTPQNKFYTKLGRDCLAAGCSVDLFLFPTSYVDVATIAEVPRITGGNLYKYNNFQADLDGDMLMDDLKTNIERQVAFNITLKLRTSTGIRPVDFFGNFHMENTTEVEMASMDGDKCVTIELKHDDKLNEAEGAMAQAVTLYTSVGGKRRMRILNTNFNCSIDASDLFRSCELDTLINYLAKLSIRDSLNSSTKQVREQLTNRCVQSLACYRKNCSSPTTPGQLILPECMKLMPLYINCMLKSSLFQYENINVDDRSYYMNLVNSMNISDTVAFFYPRLLPLHELDLDSDKLPTPMRCSQERLNENGAYLLENGLVMFLWVGLSINPEWIQKVFGVNSVAQVDIDRTKLQDYDNPLSVRVRGIIKAVRDERHRHMKVIIVRQRDRLEPVMLDHLVEDRSPITSSSLSYVEFICHIHKEIRNVLI